jgi:TolB-like protein
VASHSAALKHRGSAPSFAASFLKVRWVVAGKVTRQGQEIKLHVEVIDAPVDRVVKTATFDLSSQKGKGGTEQTAAKIAALVREAVGAN